MASKYELVIVGSGPAGLTAALYAARYNLKTIVLGKLSGGLATEAIDICNFPSYLSISGFELMSKMISQVKNLGVEIKQENVKKIKGKNNNFEVETNKGKYSGKKVIIATGTLKRRLGIGREHEFKGKGVTYCAVCDGQFYKNKTVGVVGGGDAALTAALMLSRIAKKVYVIYRQDKFFRAQQAWIKEVERNKMITPIFNSVVKKLVGKEHLEEIEIEKKGKLEKLKLDGLFVEIGGIPQNELGVELGLKLETNYIQVDKEMRTSIAGVFAAGDVTNNRLKQVITACGEGAIAAEHAYQEIVKGE